MGRRILLAANEAFYVSGTFWLTLVLIVATLLLILLAWRTLVATRNRRTLEWDQSVVPMVQGTERHEEQLEADLAVTWQRRRVSNLFLATVRLRNTGRSDIGASAFDGSRP